MLSGTLELTLLVADMAQNFEVTRLTFKVVVVVELVYKNGLVLSIIINLHFLQPPS